ncbi:unnamed protein product [Vitrella brassicaformis CCMP3155]|uniref:Uncharacterized protein n=1 Tax=Vitrella brassicaformis (strain CCMP3155) TaxID=1169540 RepID=A0A0G4FDZ1_VITBC|nr:unnamed protein product [Vitrella brassicaformis CCMP3155]|eukprot:CEM11390.1 unnamed protein product [Vitrella brassicaformis CCMP3155]
MADHGDPYEMETMCVSVCVCSNPLVQNSAELPVKDVRTVEISTRVHQPIIRPDSVSCYSVPDTSVETGDDVTDEGEPLVLCRGGFMLGHEDPDTDSSMPIFNVGILGCSKANTVLFDTDEERRAFSDRDDTQLQHLRAPHDHPPLSDAVPGAALPAHDDSRGGLVGHPDHRRRHHTKADGQVGGAKARREAPSLMEAHKRDIVPFAKVLARYAADKSWVIRALGSAAYESAYVMIGVVEAVLADDDGRSEAPLSPSGRPHKRRRVQLQ